MQQVHELRRIAVEQFEYLVVGLVGLAALLGVLAYVTTHSGSKAASAKSEPAAASATATQIGPCRADTASGTLPATCETRTAVLTIVSQDQPLGVADTTTKVTSVQALAARTAGGRARKRMRVTVALDLRNTGKTSVLAGDDPIYLNVGGQHVSPDPRALSLPGAFALSSPVGPGETRHGELRFELGGAATTAFEKSGGELGVRPVATSAGLRTPVGVVRLAAIDEHL